MPIWHNKLVSTLAYLACQSYKNLRAIVSGDQHEMPRQLKVFHIQSTFSMLHIGRWPFRYEPNYHGRSSTTGDVFRNVSFCNGMCCLCYTFKCFSCFPSAILRALQLLRLPDRWRSAPWVQKLRPVWKVFGITCRPGPKLTRSDIFVSVYLPKRVVPVWVEFLYRSHVIRQKDLYGDRSELVPVWVHPGLM